MAFVVCAGLVAVIWAGKERWSRAPAPRTLVLYGFSAMEEAIEEGVFPAFQEIWQERSGEGVELVATFAGSGAVTGEIIKRFPAEVAILSSKLDLLRLAESGVSGWQPRHPMPYDGILTRSPLVILVREGNPLGVAGFADLAKSGVTVLLTDPATSGVASWSILAGYGSALSSTGDRDLAFARLLGIWKNMSGRVISARAARSQFEEGRGDALITYEAEVIGSRIHPRIAGDVVYPPDTVMTEHTVVRLGTNVTDRQQPLVDAFLEFLWSRQAQQLFVAFGFRSPIEELNRANPDLGAIESPLTLDSLGGPSSVRREIIEAVWRQRVLPELGGGPS